MSETQKIGVFIDWHIPSRSTSGPAFAPRSNPTIRFR